MESMRISDIISITNGSCNYTDDTYISGIETDSRRIQSGYLYISIVGEKVDGHCFIDDAAQNGAVCAVISHEVTDSPIPTILVPSAEEALRSIARCYFEKVSPITVAVTGSCGKTTTKEMLYEVFATKYNALKTNGNYNSTIGLPLTVSRLSYENNAAVLEMGTGHKGEIQTMCDIVKPDIAVITNVGTCHIEFFGSREAIANEKLDIFRNVKPGGSIIVNADDTMLGKALDSENINAKKLTFGIENSADVTASNIETYQADGNYVTEFDVNYNHNTVHAKINTLGTHNVYNALSAITAGIADGILPKVSVPALLSFVPDDMRTKIFKCIDGITIISDVYNSNPQAVKASINVLNEISRGRKIIILGDMLEQGDFSEEAHADVGKYAAQFASILIARGEMATYTSGGAAEFMSYKNIQALHTNDEVKEYLSTFDYELNDTFLVKGSRGMKMEEIVNYLVKERFSYTV